jgi:hypothetical protein
MTLLDGSVQRCVWGVWVPSVVGALSHFSCHSEYNNISSEKAGQCHE